MNGWKGGCTHVHLRQHAHHPTTIDNEDSMPPAVHLRQHAHHPTTMDECNYVKSECGCLGGG